MKTMRTMRTMKTLLFCLAATNASAVQLPEKETAEMAIPLTFAPNTLHFSTLPKQHTYPLQVVGSDANMEVTCHRNRHHPLTPTTTWRCQTNFRHQKKSRRLLHPQLHRVSVHWTSAVTENRTAFLHNSWSATAYLMTKDQLVDHYESRRQLNQPGILETLFSLVIIGFATAIFVALLSNCSPDFLIGGLIGGLLYAIFLGDSDDDDYVSYCDGYSSPR